MPPDEDLDDGSHTPPPRSSSLDDPDWDEPSSSPQARKKRHVDDEDNSEVIVTLREAGSTPQVCTSRPGHGLVGQEHLHLFVPYTTGRRSSRSVEDKSQ